MAKDTEKLIRQLSLISYLMAERRPVTATEIRRDVEGYSVMNEDAFARRFYADRSELEALGIVLVGREAGRRTGRAGELLASARELPPAADRVHRQGARGAAHRAAAARRRVRVRRAAAAGAAADLLGPARVRSARRSSTRSRSGSPARRAATTSRSGWRRSRPRSSAARRSCSTTTRWSATNSGRAASIPTSSCTRAASSTSSAARTSATRSGSSGSRGCAARSATRPRPSTTSSAPPPGFRSRAPIRDRIDWQFGDAIGTAEVWISRRIAWQIERHFGRYGEMRPDGDEGDRVFTTPYANARQLIAWVLGLGEHARILGPAELTSELRDRLELLIERHSGDAQMGAKPASAARQVDVAPDEPAPSDEREIHSDAAIRPERFARLVTLASILIDAGRAARRLDAEDAAQVAEGLRPGAERGHRAAERRQLRRWHVRPVRRDRPRRDDRGRPGAVRGLVRAAGATAAGRGQGADRRDRPDRRAHPGGLAELGPREGGRGARRGPRRGGAADRARRWRRHGDRRRRLARDRPPAPAPIRVLQGERGRVLGRGPSSPTR